jgi:hypothetical protein
MSADRGSEICLMLTQLALDSCVVADLDGAHIERFGEFRDVDCAAMAVRHHFDSQTVRSLIQSMKGMLLPQVAKQGAVLGVTGFLDDGRICTLYGKSQLDPLSEYRWTRDIWRQVVAVFRKQPPFPCCEKLRLSRQLPDLLERYGFDCAVIADRDGLSLQRVGRYEDDECIAELNRDFFDPATVRALAEFLEGKVLPQVSSAAPCWSLSGFTPAGGIIAMYGCSPGDVRVQYFKSKEVWRDLEAVWLEGPPAV